MNDHAAIEIVELNDAAVGTDTAGFDARMVAEERLDTTGTRPSARPVNADAGSGNDIAVARLLDGIRSLLEEAPSGFQAETSPCTIFRIPPPLRGINPKAEEPEIVSIGPYHRGRPQVLAFERLKPLFLKRFLRRTDWDLEKLTQFVAGQEISVRTRYSENVAMTSDDLVQMMLLDGCFVVELLLHFHESGNEADENDPIFARPQIIPMIIRDLLKLENQIPYFLLQLLVSGPLPHEVTANIGSLATLALKLFNQTYPRPMALLKCWGTLKCEHLLDLFCSSLYPTSRVRPNYTKEKWPSAQSVPCVTELRPSGIKFKSRKADSLMDISFRKPVLQKWVLQIPYITIDDFMTTVLINCVSLEQCRESRSKYMTDYVSFMHCLINQPKDVSLLRSDGIIALYSHDDQYVVDLFDKLGKSISFNVYDCFLSKQFEELESYYRSNWANMMRTYFSSPWSSISAFSAFLVIVLGITQTVFAVLTFIFHR
ncbi:UPF0481 protein At3g47200-like [Syzygium oleosum]|uniref:UPF0481 protein At3g47200-like n=1 Tax=Syzygium oleosum TaxID=219896 RepID=UPI0011D276A1|nr:UPF0481 protein At3g47200-like [Syzygium oleosum]